jgi:hypothetical protein
MIDDLVEFSKEQMPCKPRPYWLAEHITLTQGYAHSKATEVKAYPNYPLLLDKSQYPKAWLDQQYAW